MEDVANLMPGLRERRRLATQREVHEAALALFEEQGVRDTTVQQIAERAGISPRTFFRHFASKEQAALPGQRRLLAEIERLELPREVRKGGLGGVLRAVEAAVESVIGREGDPDLDEHRRITRLLAREPDLARLAAAQEQELVARLRATVLAQLPGADRAAVMLLAEVAVALWRTTWEAWAEAAADGDAPDPGDVYRRNRDSLRRIVR